MSEPEQFAPDVFWDRVEALREVWCAKGTYSTAKPGAAIVASKFGGASALLLAFGKKTEDTPDYTRSESIFKHLFGVLLSNTVMLLTPTELHVLTSPNKATHVEGLASHARASASPVALKVHRFSKDDGNAAGNAALLAAFTRAIPAPGDGGEEARRLGWLGKEKAAATNSAHVSGFLAAADAADVARVDCTAGLGYALAIHDQHALAVVERAAVLSGKVLKRALIAKVEDAVDKGSSVKHTELVKTAEKAVAKPETINMKKLSPDDVELAYEPIVQSGGKYNLKVDAQSDSRPLSGDVVVLSLGMQYKAYCGNCVRTLFVDPVDKLQQVYAVLYKAFLRCLEVLTPGRPIRAVAQAAHDVFAASKFPELAAQLPKTLGWATGLVFRESSLLLNLKNETLVAEGMTFNLSLGLGEVTLSAEDRKGAKGAVAGLETCAMMLADVVKVVKSGAAEPLSRTPSMEWHSVSYEVDDESGSEDEDGDASMSDKTPKSGRKKSAADPDVEVTSSRLRDRGDRDASHSEAAHRAQQQAELMQKHILAMQEEYEKEGKVDKKSKKIRADDVKELASYKSSYNFPFDIPTNEVSVDPDRDCIFLPIGGAPVPFHISLVKMVAQPEPDRAAYLKLQLYCPGQVAAKDTPAVAKALVERHDKDSNVFVKELLYRSLEHKKLNTAFRKIQDLRKKYRQRERQQQEESGLIEQVRLVKLRDRVPRLDDLVMRPTMSGRKSSGTLEVHQNGALFRSRKGETFELIYDNIKHAVFQPCENEVMVLVHFHLRNPVMIGKKRSVDVQFYTDVVEASENLDQHRSRQYDPDELEEEQQEKRMRKKLNEAFKHFCKKMEATSKHHGVGIEFDVPYRELSFMGVANKEMVRLQPTVKCLVNLTESPAFLLDLDVIEHVHFERVNYGGGKNFDVVFINKDFEKNVVQVTSIDMSELDAIQVWLTECGLTYTHGNMSLQWTQVMKTIAEDDRFYLSTEPDEVTRKPAGFEFLSLSYESDDGEGEDEDEDESEFEGGSEAGSGASSGSESESDFDSDSEGSEDADDSDDSDGEEEGEDWEDLEREAKASDRARDARQGDYDDRVKKKPRR